MSDAAIPQPITHAPANYAAIGQVMFFEQEWQHSRSRVATDPTDAAVHEAVANTLAWARSLLTCDPQRLVQMPRIDGGDAATGPPEVIHR